MKALDDFLHSGGGTRRDKRRINKRIVFTLPSTLFAACGLCLPGAGNTIMVVRLRVCVVFACYPPLHFHPSSNSLFIMMCYAPFQLLALETGCRQDDMNYQGVRCRGLNLLSWLLEEPTGEIYTNKHALSW